MAAGGGLFEDFAGGARQPLEAWGGLWAYSAGGQLVPAEVRRSDLRVLGRRLPGFAKYDKVRAWRVADNYTVWVGHSSETGRGKAAVFEGTDVASMGEKGFPGRLLDVYMHNGALYFLTVSTSAFLPIVGVFLFTPTGDDMFESFNMPFTKNIVDAAFDFVHGLGVQFVVEKDGEYAAYYTDTGDVDETRVDFQADPLVLVGRSVIFSRANELLLRHPQGYKRVEGRLVDHSPLSEIFLVETDFTTRAYTDFGMFAIYRQPVQLVGPGVIIKT